MAHYEAQIPIVSLLVASINRLLSGCLNQNNSNTAPRNDALSTANTEHRDGAGREGGREREKERGGEVRGEKTGGAGWGGERGWGAGRRGGERRGKDRNHRYFECLSSLAIRDTQTQTLSFMNL